MRRVLLAILLLTSPLAGCLDVGATTVEEPTWPTGLLLTYEIEDANGTDRETFLVHNGTPQGTDLLAWNLSEERSGPLRAFDDSHEPRAAGFADVFAFPIEAGDEHQATVAGRPVTMHWSEVPHEGPLDQETDLEGVARDDGGEAVARLRVSTDGNATVTYAQLPTGEGGNETWRLADAHHHAGWNQAPSWTKGDWWTYNGTFRGQDGTAQIVYTTDASGQGSQQAVLSPVEVEDRVLMLPFQKWRKDDKAPQSGYVSSMMSSFWSWPLRDGKTWGGSTSAGGDAGKYSAASQLAPGTRLPDGTLTTTFRVQAVAHGAQEPFATYTYAPLVEHLVSWRITDGGDEPALNYSLEDWGQAYHGEMEIPRRLQLDEIPQQGSFLSGPAQVDRTFEVPEEARTVQIAPRSFAVHEPDADPSFQLTLADPNGTVQIEHNDTAFAERRLSLAETVEAQPGTWRLQVDVGEGVSVLARLYANWYETETVDFR